MMNVHREETVRLCWMKVDRVRENTISHPVIIIQLPCKESTC